jgi:hypothetical protein
VVGVVKTGLWIRRVSLTPTILSWTWRGVNWLLNWDLITHPYQLFQRSLVSGIGAVRFVSIRRHLLTLNWRSNCPIIHNSWKIFLKYSRHYSVKFDSAVARNLPHFGFWECCFSVGGQLLKVIKGGRSNLF